MLPSSGVRLLQKVVFEETLKLNKIGEQQWLFEFKNLNSYL